LSARRAGWLLACAGALCAVAVATLGNGQPEQPADYVLVGGHAVGIGEQQVFAIVRESQLTFRFRDAGGVVRTHAYRNRALSSVAFTIEGLSSQGAAVLAITNSHMTAPPAQPSATATPLAPYAAIYASPTAAPSVTPSPQVNANGAVSASDAADLAPLSALLSGLTAGIPASDAGPWKSGAEVQVPHARVTIALSNTVASPAPDESNPIMHLVAAGTADARGTATVASVGTVVFSGAGTATANAYLDPQAKLALGMLLHSFSHGNARANRQRGTFTLLVDVTVKLVHFTPGLPPLPLTPGYVIASGYVGSYASPDTGNLTPAPANPVAVPAATDTEYVGSPPPSYVPSPLPEASLPPIPIPLPSDQPIVSPPPGPTPTPTPTRY